MSMANYKVTLQTSDRDRIERRIQNSILAASVQVVSGGIFEPRDAGDRARKIARLVSDDLLKDYRLVPRK